MLDVTHNLIKQKGFYKLNIEDITQSAGVAKGTFYTYFKHKEEIVLEICKGLFKQTQSKLEQLKNSNISERLFCYFECFIKEVQGYQIHIVREWIKGLVEKGENNESMGIIKCEYDTKMLKNILTQAIQNNELNKNTPTETLTYIILCQMYGMLTCWCMSDGELNPENMTKEIFKIQIKPLIKPYLT